MSSQWPVTESLPGDASRHAAEGGHRRHRGAADRATERRSRPSAPTASAAAAGHVRRDVAEGVAAFVTVRGGSGSSPMPTLSMDDDDDAARPRATGSAMADYWPRGGVVAADAARRADRRNRVLEHEVVDAGVIDDQREAIEVLDAAFDRLAVEELDDDGQLLASGVVQEDVLDVRRASRLRLAAGLAARSGPMGRPMRGTVPGVPAGVGGPMALMARGVGRTLRRDGGSTRRRRGAARRARRVGGTRRGRVRLTGEQGGGVLGRQHHRNGIRNQKRNR